MTEANSRFRLTIVGFVVFALFCGLFARLWFLQVGDATSAAAQTERNRLRVVREPAIRGSIVDRNGVSLVQNTLVDTITVQRGLSDAERAVTVKNLAALFGTTEDEVNAQLDSTKYSVYEPVPVAQNAPYEQLVYVREHPELFPGVSAERESVREYPQRLNLPGEPPLGAHLLGYVGLINKREYKIQHDAGYSQNDLIGKEGVEQLFESELRGKPRERRLEVDSVGRLVGTAKEIAPTPGNDIELTIDANVQRVAEESLADGMSQARGFVDRITGRRYQATGGSVVVLDAQSGDIVALASAPTYDIASFTNGIPVEQFSELTKPENGLPLTDRAVQGLYAPGSTFKPFSAYAALRDGVPTATGPFDEATTVLDKGFITWEGRDYQNAGKVANGYVDLDRALTVSSDVYFYTIGLWYWQGYGKGNEADGNLSHPQYGLQRAAKTFGFGTATGIGLPGEARGRIPDLAFKQKLNVDNPETSTHIWLPGDSMNLAVGQGDVLVTPLQLASAYGALANGGTLYQPRLAKRILQGGSTLGSDKVVRVLPEQPAKKLDIDPDILAKLLPGLEGAVCAPDGTASGAFHGYACGDVMGKTGTAEVGSGQDTALFVGVSPAHVDPANPQPQYVVAVVVEQGGFGGSVAAPIARRVFDALKGDPNPKPVQTYAPSHD